MNVNLVTKRTRPSTYSSIRDQILELLSKEGGSVEGICEELKIEIEGLTPELKNELRHMCDKKMSARIVEFDTFTIKAAKANLANAASGVEKVNIPLVRFARTLMSTHKATLLRSLTPHEESVTPIDLSFLQDAPTLSIQNITINTNESSEMKEVNPAKSPIIINAET